MKLNADFGERVLVHSEEIAWVPSPMPGVHRRMLDRIGDEVARATTIVRYAPRSKFSTHTHTGGEEYVVLDGVFQDEHGNFPVGTYVRNPPTSFHTPSSDLGCTIFVKLWQFDTADRTQFRKTMSEDLEQSTAGVATKTLHQDERETVLYIELDPDASTTIADVGGIELLVISGAVKEGPDSLRKGSWLRIPDGQKMEATAGAEGAKLWVKSGHLRFVQEPSV